MERSLIPARKPPENTSMGSYRKVDSHVKDSGVLLRPWGKARDPIKKPKRRRNGIPPSTKSLAMKRKGDNFNYIKIKDLCSLEGIKS